MTNKKSISKFFLYSLILFSFVSVFTIGSLWIVHEKIAMQNTLSTLKEQYISETKNILKNTIHIADIIIKHQQKNHPPKNENLFSEVSEITYGKNGYIFIVDYSGNTIFNANKSLIGKNVIDLKDVNGKYFIKDMISLAKSKKNGFITYWWQKPNRKSSSEKISFIKGYPKLNLFIGAGIYTDDILAKIENKKIIIENRISQTIQYSILILILILMLNWISAIFLSKKIRHSYDLFSSFFENAVRLNIKLDPEKNYFDEFKELSSFANEMLADKLKIEENQEDLIEELQISLENIKTLDGLLPVCSKCKKIRDDRGYWNQVDNYLSSHSKAIISHSLCPDCKEELYGEMEWYKKAKAKREKKNLKN